MTKQAELAEDACRVCGREDDESFLVLCDGCDRPFHTYCHAGCVCCRQKPKGNFNRKPAVPDGDWFCKFCAGHIRLPDDGEAPVSAVYAWGDNEDDQLGLLDVDEKTVWSPTRVRQLDGIGVVQIAGTETSTLLLANDGNIYSVGTGTSGQLGHSDVVHEKLGRFRLIESLIAEKRPKIEGSFKEICTGRDFCLALTTEGHVYTWGNGDVGQLGHQANKIKKIPKKISALRELEIPVDLACCGDDFVLMTSKELPDADQFSTQRPGVMMSMGANTHGQLGDGSGRNQWVPQLLNKDGPEYTKSDDGDIEEPTEFLLGRDIRILAAGKSHCIAVPSRMKGIWTWGFGELGQLGIPKPQPAPGQSRFFRSQFRVPRPRFVKALTNEVVTQVACGGQHSLLLLADGRLFGMGDNEFGQVGVPNDGQEDGTKATIDVPVHISASSILGAIRQIACGDKHSVALSSDGFVFTWGHNELGQLGQGETGAPVRTPTKVEGLQPMKKIFSGPNQVFTVEFTDDTIKTNTAFATSSKAGVGNGGRGVAPAGKKRGAPWRASGAPSKKSKH